MPTIEQIVVLILWDYILVNATLKKSGHVPFENEGRFKINTLTNWYSRA